MKFQEQRLPGVFVIDAEPFEDERGAFRRNFCRAEFARHGVTADAVQCNVSENPFTHTLRGFHYQLPPDGEGKTLNCFRGAIYDVVVDLRPQSPTYLQWLAVELTAANRRSLHVPPGCANAFLTLGDDSLIFYYCSHHYVPQAERGIRFDDPTFGFKWPHPPAVISNKDASWPDFQSGQR